jgi:hypothetical protein
LTGDVSLPAAADLPNSRGIAFPAGARGACAVGVEGGASPRFAVDLQMGFRGPFLRLSSDRDSIG